MHFKRKKTCGGGRPAIKDGILQLGGERQKSKFITPLQLLLMLVKKVLRGKKKPIKQKGSTFSIALLISPVAPLVTGYFWTRKKK